MQVNTGVKKKKKIVLLFPNLECKETRKFPIYWQRVPLQLLSLARMFNPEEYTITLIDAKMEDDVESRVLNELNRSSCLGVSAIIGNQLVEGLRISQLVKERYPEIPIVWGGWFPSMAPEVTIANPFIDIVIRGQGEFTFLELVTRLSQSREIGDIPGIVYKVNNEVKVNPPRSAEDINKFPPMPYHLLDMERYLGIEKGKTRVINYLSSIGCPYQCIFCSDNILYERKWISLAPERVVNDLEMLVNKLRVTHVIFDDPSFFINKTRTGQICEMIINRGLAGKFLWYATGNADRVARLDDDELDLIRKSGGGSVYIGAESGSPLTLKSLGKNITVDDILRSAEKLKKHNISVTMSFLVGSPVEEDVELDKSIDLSYKVILANPNTQFHINLFSPIPGIKALDLPQVKKVFKEPSSLEEWAKLDYIRGNVFFKGKEYLTKANRFRFCTTAAYRLKQASLDSKNPFLKTAFAILRRMFLYRLKYKFFRLPVELYLLKLYKLVVPRSKLSYTLSITKQKV